MARPQFNQLSTEKFRLRMRPKAEAIYRAIWPRSELRDLRQDGVEVHVLDKEFGIDTLATFMTGQWISIQEKYRKNKFFNEPRLKVSPPWPDFTQEFKNAAGTPHESPGEWFKLGAQLYFYGWANAQESDFAAWVILDIAKYKLLIESRGGLDCVGKINGNRQHGRATFYAISMKELQEAVIFRGRGTTFEMAHKIQAA